MSTERLLHLHSFCDAIGINVKDVRVSSSKEDFVRVECQLCNKSIKYHCFSNHTKSVHNMILKVYEQKYGNRIKHVRDKVLHQCVECGDFMILDYIAIKSHLRSHSKPLSEYFAEVLSETNTEKVKTTDGRDLKTEYIDSETPEKGVFQCGECDKSFNYKKYFQVHMRRHKNGLPGVQNNINDKLTSSTKDSKDDPKNTGSPAGGRVACPACGTGFASKSGLNKHVLLKHTPRENWPFQCPLCQQKFTARGDKRRHLLLTNYTNHAGVEIPAENSLEFRELLYSEMKSFNIKAEPEPIVETTDIDKISNGIKSSLLLEIIGHNDINVDIKSEVPVVNNSENCDNNISETLNEEAEELEKNLAQEALTPLDALVMRIDNNERIPTDELISIINQIVKS